MSDIKELRDHVKGGSNTKDFSMAGVVLKPAYCCSVYDGDTIDIISKYMGSYYRFTLRMMGYDSPEKRTKKKILRPKKKLKLESYGLITPKNIYYGLLKIIST